MISHVFFFNNKQTFHYYCSMIQTLERVKEDKKNSQNKSNYKLEIVIEARYKCLQVEQIIPAE